MQLQGRRGEGAFQWNRGGWFGSQLGATLWLVLLGGMLLARSEPVGGLVLLSGLVPNGVGLVLWRRRETLAPYPAVQALIAVCGLGALGALLCIGASGVAMSASQVPSGWLLLMYPGLMLAFHLQERAARKSAT